MIGKKVYIEELEQFGHVVEVSGDRQVSKVKIKTPDGEKIIDAIKFTIRLLYWIEQLLPYLDRLYRKLFKGKSG